MTSHIRFRSGLVKSMISRITPNSSAMKATSAITPAIRKRAMFTRAWTLFGVSATRAAGEADLSVMMTLLDSPRGESRRRRALSLVLLPTA
jgi:hypothetical protein